MGQTPKYQLNTIRINQFFLKEHSVAFEFLKLLHHHGVEARFVGNVVRQYLFNYFHEKKIQSLQISEYDICVNASPQQLKQILKVLDISFLQENMNYGTFKFCYGQQNLELACLRRDYNHKGRHCIVEFIDSFELDTSRRDFTFNAITIDHHGCIFDYHNGQEDIMQKHVHFILEAKKSIQEDVLRLWRYVRFCAEFDVKPDLSIMQYAREYSDLLKKLPFKKILYEWHKIIKKDHNVLFYLKTLHDYDMTQNFLGNFIYPTDSEVFVKKNINAYYPNIPKWALDAIH